VIIDILTGKVQTGKTTLLRKITLELKRKGVRVGGFLNLSVYEKDQVIGYDLYNLKEETMRPFLRKQGQTNWEKIGPYSFIPDTLELAKSTILRAKNIDICFVDEVGPYELEGKGLWPSLVAILECPIPRLFLTVRAKLLNAFIEKLGKNVDKIFDVADEDVHPRIIAHLEQKFVR
jgi:nucleoside-triphosphatase THEP1